MVNPRLRHAHLFAANASPQDRKRAQQLQRLLKFSAPAVRRMRATRSSQRLQTDHKRAAAPLAPLPVVDAVPAAQEVQPADPLPLLPPTVADAQLPANHDVQPAAPPARQSKIYALLMAPLADPDVPLPPPVHRPLLTPEAAIEMLCSLPHTTVYMKVATTAGISAKEIVALDHAYCK